MISLMQLLIITIIVLLLLLLLLLLISLILILVIDRCDCISVELIHHCHNMWTMDYLKEQ